MTDLALILKFERPKMTATLISLVAKTATEFFTAFKFWNRFPGQVQRVIELQRVGVAKLLRVNAKLWMIAREIAGDRVHRESGGTFRVPAFIGCGQNCIRSPVTKSAIGISRSHHSPRPAMFTMTKRTGEIARNTWLMKEVVRVTLLT